MALRQPSAGPARPGAPASEADSLRHLGFDLHDGPLQELAAVGAGLYLLQLDLADPTEALPPSEAVERVDALRKALGDALGALRDLAAAAADGPLLAGPFSVTLERAALQSGGGCSVELDVDSAVDLLPIRDEERLALIHIVQSAVTNAVHHSGGSTVSVAARPTVRGLLVEVADDGHGFSVRSALRRAGRDGRLGLLGMQERADDVGATLYVRSRAGNGTRVVAELEIPGNGDER